MMTATALHWYRGFVRGKTRITIAWIFAACLVLSARTYPNLIGILICFVGATLRFWASGYLRKDQRLAVGGPYAHIRHPLYFGTFLMAIGITISIESWIFTLILVALFAAIYRFTIVDEETKLREVFGEPHRIYCDNVPGFYPRLKPASVETLKAVNPDPEAYRYNWEISTKNKAYEAYVTWIALVGFVTLAAWVWKLFI